MALSHSRRGFLGRTLGAAAFAGLHDLGFLSQLPPVSASEVVINPDNVRFSPEIEPLVRLLEDTPEDRAIEVVAERIKGGLPYRDLLTALQLATVRTMKPHPLGFAFHCVLAINAAHLASQAAPAQYRWLPLFWAVSDFKKHQPKAKAGNWTLPAPKESRLPSPSKAKQAFITAMDAWDEEAADAAITALARTAGEQEIFELLFRYGARGFRNIGHKAIFVANSRRTIDNIGWQNAEPVLRSLASGLLDYKGKNPSTFEAPEDQSWRTNAPRAARFPIDWTAGRIDPAATSDLLAACRQGTADDSADKVVEMIGKGIAPQSVWDGIFVGAGEVLLRDRAIIGIHAVTTANALHFAFQTSGDDTLRRMILLQAAAFLPQFLAEARGRKPNFPDGNLEKLEPLPLSAPADHAVAEVLTEMGQNRPAAAGKILTLLKDHPPRDLIDAARLQVFFKGDDAHDYKFSSAMFEDYAHVSPDWRARYLSSGALFLRSEKDKENPAIQRARAALQG